MEIELTVEMPKDKKKKIKKNDPSAYRNNGAIMLGLSYNHSCKESGSIPATLDNNNT